MKPFIVQSSSHKTNLFFNPSSMKLIALKQPTKFRFISKIIIYIIILIDYLLISFEDMFMVEDQEILQKFYTDVVNSVAFQTPINYLEKYQIIDDYEVIVHTEEEILKILYAIVANQIQKPSKISELLTQKAIDDKLNHILSVIISNKIQDIRKYVLRKEISRGGLYLLDHNWRIVNVLGTNWSVKENKVILNLMLMLRGSNNQQLQKQINLQMNIYEVQSFLNVLKQVKRNLKA